MNRKRLGLLAVAFILVVGVLEVAVLRIGSLEFPVPPGSQHPAVADNPGEH
ncbi:hypothetical protein [Actinomadura formosensis]|uniref:hypothetical protein n=1 Tax=Actinomadura formosensis TaxID=60706 RepID=UPI0012F9D6E0|nr:hypothetical protein [Actinomadura formosensis]